MERTPLTKDDIAVSDELLFESDHVNAYIETWFDADEKFGIQTEDIDEVNLYANYYPETKDVDLFYSVRHDDGSSDDEVHLENVSQEEKDLIFDLINEKCIQEDEMGVDELFETLKAEEFNISMQ